MQRLKLSLRTIKKIFTPLRTKILLITLVVVLLLFHHQFYRLKPKKSIDPVLKERLSSLGEQALLHRDVPIAALLVYHDSIIGEGYNTVNRDSNMSGHAEINAINDAFKKYGTQFKHLDRDKLVLYSTYEPCEMCKGAIIQNGIKHVYFEQNKPALHQVKVMLKNILYHLSTRRFDAPDLQESLFLKHPTYKK